VHRAQRMRWLDWLRLPVFYRVALVYMFVRLATNVSQVYLTFFIAVSLQMSELAIAILPLIVYLSQLAATLAAKRLSVRLGRRNSLVCGAAIFCAACAAMFATPAGASAAMYPTVALLGAGSAITMVISVSLEADLVGRNIESAAFVYGAISFTDKLANGVAVLAIQFVFEALPDDEQRAAYRLVNSALPLAAMLAAVLVACTITFPSHLEAARAPAAAAGSLNAGAAAATAALKPPRRPGFIARVSSFLVPATPPRGGGNAAERFDGDGLLLDAARGPR